MSIHPALTAFLSASLVFAASCKSTKKPGPTILSAGTSASPAGPDLPSLPSEASTAAEAGAASAPFPDPRVREDELVVIFKKITLARPKEAPDLAARLTFRTDPGWLAFVNALLVCDQTVNGLLEEDITDWSEASHKIEAVNRARNAWRTACTYGIIPPDLPKGTATFSESGIEFRITVKSDAEGTLIARSPRGQVMGIFDLKLWDDGNQHVTAHMLQGAIRYPDIYINYPWNIIMATDTIFVDDIFVELDRLDRSALIYERFGSRFERRPERSASKD